MKARKIGIISAVIVTAVTIAAMVPVLARATNTYSDKGIITVNGEGKVNVIPDVAYITVGVTNTNKDAKDGQTENGLKMTELIAAIKAQGIPDNDIQTTGYSIYPVYDKEKHEKIEGYTINNSLNITVRDLEIIGAVLETALSNGGNVAGGINFSILDSTKAYEEALALAVSNAGSKSLAIAKSLGKIVNETPIQINESGSYYAPYLRSEAMVSNSLMYDRATDYIQSGQLSVTANIQAVYEFE